MLCKLVVGSYCIPYRAAIHRFLTVFLEYAVVSLLMLHQSNEQIIILMCIPTHIKTEKIKRGQ